MKKFIRYFVLLILMSLHPIFQSHVHDLSGSRFYPQLTGFKERAFTCQNGKTIRYSVWVPENISNDSIPLVMSLHYGGEVLPWYSMGFLKILVEPAFRDLGGILIAPDCPGEGWTDPVSETAVLELLDYAMHTWPLDPKRVVITGYSMGGKGTWFMASRHSGLFSAAIPVPGMPVGNPVIKIPVYAINSRQDKIIDFRLTKAKIKVIKGEGVQVNFILLNGPGHYQTEAFVEPLKNSVRWLQKIWK